MPEEIIRYSDYYNNVYMDNLNFAEKTGNIMLLGNLKNIRIAGAVDYE